MKQPGFTLVAMLTLALGIGVNTALFTIFNVFVLQPLPLRDPDSLVEIRGVNPRGTPVKTSSRIPTIWTTVNAAGRWRN